MKLVRVAAGVLNQTPLDWQRNCDNIIQAIQQARENQIGILCLPELCITGYGCEDAFHGRGILKTSQEVLAEIVKQTEGIAVSVGLPMMYAGGLFNTAALLCDGKIVGVAAKQHLAGDGIHYEPRWFKRWPDGIRGDIEILGQNYPIGDLLFDCGGIKIGFEICEDAWVGTRPGSSLASRGADVILNPSASHFAFDKHAVRRRIVVNGSQAFHVVYVYANLVGNEAGRAVYDGDAMIASGGKLLKTGRRFAYQDVLLTEATVDIESNRMSRLRTGSFEPDLDGDESDIVRCEFKYPEVSPVVQENVREDWETSEDIKFEEFTRSVSLALFDYMVKSRSRGVVVSLSGGVDSASVIVLARKMLELALADLQIEGLRERIGYVGLQDNDCSIEQLSAELLTTVYQATGNSSDTTRKAASGLAAAIHTRHYEFDVDALVNDYVSMVSQSIGRELTWEQDDIALQNIQARVRSPGVWMLSNLFNALLLTISNRSEAAVGYATMDGDTSGGLAPIAGIDKAFLRRWLHWMEIEGPSGLAPIPELSAINCQSPTAELRPQDSCQTDEDDLMPYDKLDEIERLAIRDKRTPVEVFIKMSGTYPEIDRQVLAQWVEKFFRLFTRNQWKRERYAPSFHLDDENLDPKTWCRYPILSGGRQRELEEMWAFVNSN